MGRTAWERDLLLFRAVQGPQRRITVLHMLDSSMAPGTFHPCGHCDAWELYDASSSADEPPIAAATTRLLEDGRSVELTSVAVASSRRREGIGRRMVDDLADALRARGALQLVTAAIPDGHSAAIVLQRWGFSRFPRETADDPPTSAGVTFSVEL